MGAVQVVVVTLFQLIFSLLRKLFASSFSLLVDVKRKKKIYLIQTPVPQPFYDRVFHVKISIFYKYLVVVTKLIYNLTLKFITFYKNNYLISLEFINIRHKKIISLILQVFVLTILMFTFKQIPILFYFDIM